MGQRQGILEDKFVSKEAGMYRALLEYVHNIQVDDSGQLIFYLSKDNVPDLEIPLEAVFVDAVDIISTHKEFTDLLFEGESDEKDFIVHVTPSTDNSRYICMKNNKIFVKRSNNQDEITWILTNSFTNGRYMESKLQSKAYGDLLSSKENGKVIPLPASSGDPLSPFKLIRVTRSLTFNMQLVPEGFNGRRLFHRQTRKLEYREFEPKYDDDRYNFDIFFKGLFTVK